MDIHPWTKYEVARAPRRGAPPPSPGCVQGALGGADGGAIDALAVESRGPSSRIPAPRSGCFDARVGIAQASGGGPVGLHRKGTTLCVLEREVQRGAKNPLRWLSTERSPSRRMCWTARQARPPAALAVGTFCRRSYGHDDASTSRLSTSSMSVTALSVTGVEWGRSIQSQGRYQDADQAHRSDLVVLVIAFGMGLGASVGEWRSPAAASPETAHAQPIG